MEKSVIFRDRQELQSADLNNVQDFARASLDHIVKDAIESNKGYTGFSASKTAAAEVTLTAGRLYAGGEVYDSPDDVVLDLFNLLPLVTRKRVAIVAWGQSVDTDVQPRDFLIDAQLGTTEPQSVAMENDRHCEVSTVAGTESPDPSYPTTDANVTVIAYVVLDTTGVVSIERWTATELPNLSLVADRVTLLELWRGQISGQVDTLRTDLSALADRMKTLALKSDLVDLTGQLEDLRKKVYEPAAYIYYGTDHFLDKTGTNEDAQGYDAVVDEGIRFPGAGTATGALALLNPNDVYVTQSSNFVLPKYAPAVRMDLTGYSSETRMAVYSYETTDVVTLYRARERRRYGGSMTVCTNGAWWRSGSYDSVTNTFRINGETWEVAAGDVARASINHQMIRVTQFWTDTYEEPYLDSVTTTHNISGQQVAQTFLNSQDGWLTQVGLYFSRKADAGDVSVVVCETAFGMPDLKRAIALTTVSVGSIQTGAISGGAGLPSLVETKVSLPPTYLKAGRRYAIVLITAGDHYVAMSDSDNAVVQGTFFTSTDGAFFAGNLVEDMKLRLYFAKFERPRLSVEFSPLQLAGGILDIDILNEGITPPACRTDFEVQINGAWVPFAAYPSGPNLTGLPALLPLRATLTGTTDLMPGFGIGAAKSQTAVTRPKTAFTWIGTTRNLGSASSSIKVAVDLQAFDDAKHDCTVALMTGAALDTEEAADVVEDVTLLDGTIRRTVTINPAAAIDTYAIKIVGSATSAAELFHVAELIEYSQA